MTSCYAFKAGDILIVRTNKTWLALSPSAFTLPVSAPTSGTERREEDGSDEDDDVLGKAVFQHPSNVAPDINVTFWVTMLSRQSALLSWRTSLVDADVLRDGFQVVFRPEGARSGL